MHTAQEMVREFHRAIGQEISPSEPMLRQPMLRASLIIEEAMETAFALVGTTSAYALAQKILLDLQLKSARKEISDCPNIIEAIDGCIDVLVVTYGTLESIGVDAEPFFDEVQKANMAKATGPIRADGKRLKPEGWTPPNISGVLRNIQAEALWK